MALEVAKEYHSGIMDPSRVAAQFEKFLSVKKNIGAKEKITKKAK